MLFEMKCRTYWKTGVDLFSRNARNPKSEYIFVFGLLDLFVGLFWFGLNYEEEKLVRWKRMLRISMNREGVNSMNQFS